jgi:hypothetical protein
MARLFAPLPFALLLIAGAPIVSAQGTTRAASNEAIFHGSASQLEGQTFSLQGLNVAITSYHSGGFTNTELVVRLENPTSQFITVSWMDLALVDANGEQFERYDRNRGKLNAPEAQVRIAPGAHISHGFLLVGSASSVKLPAKLYFQGKLLADIEK